MKLNPRTKTNGMLSSLRIAVACVLLVGAAGMALFAAVPYDAPKNDSANSADPKSKNGVYIVQMKDAPAVVYKGGVAGYKATAPKAGQKIDPFNTDVVRYSGYLKAKHDETLAKVSSASKLYSYTFTFNGFAAKLSAQEASALGKQDGVVAVNPDEAMHIDTSFTPQFLGLTAPGGLWDQLGGPVGGKNVNGAGEGI